VNVVASEVGGWGGDGDLLGAAELAEALGVGVPTVSQRVKA
jgi:hypothetical protein